MLAVVFMVDAALTFLWSVFDATQKTVKEGATTIIGAIIQAVLCFVAAGVGGKFAFVLGIIFAALNGLAIFTSLLTGRLVKFLFCLVFTVLYIVALVETK